MGALVSRTRKGAKAYVLRPFKRRGYFLTQEEYRERNPTLFDKIASGKYTEEAVEKMKLKRRDDFLALRRQTLPDQAAELLYEAGQPYLSVSSLL